MSGANYFYIHTHIHPPTHTYWISQEEIDAKAKDWADDHPEEARRIFL
jgi:hypothetical protein